LVNRYPAHLGFNSPPGNSPMLTRRHFLRSSAAIAAAGTVAPHHLLADPLPIPPGLELYTVNDAMKADLPGTLKQVAAIGYKFVEAANPGPTMQATRDFRAALDATGLVCTAVHLNYTTGDLALQLAQAKVLGVTFAGSSTLLPEGVTASASNPRPLETLSADDYQRLAERINLLAAETTIVGLTYTYHNHDHEFRPLKGDVCGYDILVKNTDANIVFFEVDCGWMLLGGHSPAKFIHENPKRVRALHIKAFAKDGPAVSYSTAVNARPAGMMLGQGRFDYAPIFAAAAHSGVAYYFVEQEPPFPPNTTSLQAAAIDYKYLRSLPPASRY
jgi:sugar phosphate isomerase/epimerase